MRKLLHFILLFSTIIFTSCSQDDYEVVFTDGFSGNAEQQNVGIKPDVKNLTTLDAETVAKIFKSRQSPTRSTVESEVSSIVKIADKEGNTALYAVNFSSGGYLIVPATKALPPVLAVVDEGEFSNDDEPFGRDVLISQMIDEVQYWRDKGENPDYSTAWRSFTKYVVPDCELPSRAEPNADVWYAQSEIMDELSQQGYVCYPLRFMEEEQEDIPAAILERFQERAKFEDNIWEEDNPNIMYETAFIAVKDYNNPSYSSYLLKTHWHQGRPYCNSVSSGDPLGCVTVAVGQIMRYHKYPTFYNWDAMPYESGNNIYGETTCSIFLKRLRDDLGVNSNGGATIDDASRVLKTYGYNVIKENHETGTYKKMPTYCRGNTSKSGANGHAWVCDGTAYNSYRTDYELYMLDNAYYPKFMFMKMDEQIQQTSYHLYHMNWGFDVNNYGVYRDGFFFDGSLGINVNNEYMKFDYNRKDLVISKP